MYVAMQKTTQYRDRELDPGNKSPTAERRMICSIARR
jgi:hypothetical protein